jgi:hypothetical protein
MSLEHLEERLEKAIEDVEDALRALGAAPVGYMTTEEFSDTLHLLQAMASGIDRFARDVLLREPIPPEVEQMYRKIATTYKTVEG